MDESRRMVLRVGWTLLALAAAYMAALAYCVTNRVEHSSSIGLPGLIGGYFILKGNWRAVRIVAQSSALCRSSGRNRENPV